MTLNCSWSIINLGWFVAYCFRLSIKLAGLELVPAPKMLLLIGTLPVFGDFHQHRRNEAQPNRVVREQPGDGVCLLIPRSRCPTRLAGHSQPAPMTALPESEDGTGLRNRLLDPDEQLPYQASAARPRRRPDSPSRPSAAANSQAAAGNGTAEKFICRPAVPLAAVHAGDSSVRCWPSQFVTSRL